MSHAHQDGHTDCIAGRPPGSDAEPPLSARRLSQSFLAGRAVTSLGDGLWFTIWALYLTNERGFGIATMGLAVGIGGVLGLGAAAPAGRLADRLGPSAVLVALSLVQAAAAVAYLTVGSFAALILLTAVFTGSDSAATGVRVALVSMALDGDERTPLLARGRAVQHVFYAAGAGCGALVVAEGSAGAYQAAIVVNAVSFLIAALCACWAWVRPKVRDAALVTRAAALALRDSPFIGLMATTAVFALCMAMLSTGLPLWVDATHAPLWLSPAGVVISCAAIALGQVRASSYTRGLSSAVRVARFAGLALAVSCVVLSTAGLTTSGGLAGALIVLGVLFQIVGELAYVASRWELSLRLMDPVAQGQYQGLAATAEAAVLAVGPAMVALLIGAFGGAGWLALAPLFLLATVPIPWLCRAATRRRALPDLEWRTT